VKDDEALADERSLKRSSIVFLVVWASGVGIFALRWFDLVPASFDFLFFVLVIAGMVMAITSIPKTLQIYKQRHHEKDKQ
jgi:Kef-type K+ transport system membrane component KefB